ncbi:4-hydroxybenzoate polyprenyltransferase [Clostridium tetanomorphum]|uniref:Decaprenyl-phosphate phosphoribosyltransferase n=1 Tax=Clostridium tetanomorphum TaxID=1553 RepID=A0A923E9G9_CLOTT|nr:decaprenyl-phosphate phosphoribosyltransferase [Clostridium tetanomorphum]KAJ51584.1 phosphoribose diphosphate:decaprenyl-phosphate phosphoribosyltransferase [Clostridium tetanomorphum DSM 665]MBC2398938.1 decaprenyl-phosphate phosphoribosyltransferase [Clostridium tetanomorphum]MBP1865233.1 4-hydroxybenzoate polyprenyltransferase [Clostridium tetanomorphum]NRS84628.1 4-hydroxybenzoate polyprenyltransferase [Clostridium tetanomorphum]NRZ97843.1 4-hydroxybenzoate polyprenyltransferase [Clost
MDLKALIKLMRPKQWIKNSFVFAALIFSGRFVEVPLLLINVKTFILFCITSSTVYILNDLVDIEKDKIHPEKKNRPLPSGRISKNLAIIFDIILLGVVIGGSINNLKLFIILFTYLLINVLYSFKLKNIVIIDVMIITFGFVLRVEAGSISTNIPISPWLILCTTLLSLFLALNKRKSEIITLESKGANHRKILKEYSIEFIDSMLTIVTPSILMAYCLYTFNSVQNRSMMITIPFVLYGIFRYQYLMYKKNIGGKPEDIFTKDMPFLINILLWIVSVLIIIYFRI